MSNLIITSFEQIQALLSKDLCWFLVYEAVMDTSDKLRIQGDPQDLEESKAMLYDFALRYYLSKNISRRLFKGRKITLSDSAFAGAKECFALQIPDVSTLELSRYINYLETWADEHEDWTIDRPESFETLEIVY